MNKYTVKVTSITTLEVEADTDDEAIDKACDSAWEYDPDERTAEITKCRLSEKYTDVCENLDWRVHEYENNTVDLEKYSPAGEDFIFGVKADGFVENVKEYAAGFDVDAHIELWVESRGKQGVPSRIRELVEDAEAIDKMLQELAAALAEVEDEEDA